MKKIFFTSMLLTILCTGAVFCQRPENTALKAEEKQDTTSEGNKPGSYHTHDELIEMFRKECDKFPKLTSYKSIGQTTLNNDIWAFSFGNPNGGKVILDGCLHGWEDMGSEAAYVFVKWMLESNEPLAKKFLKENYWIVIPVVNYDTYNRGNMNHNLCQGGIDLNRNFLRGWEFVDACNGDYGTSHGATAGSEQETKVMRAFMEANKPSGGRKAAFINTHLGGGPWIHYDGTDADEYYTPLRNRIIELWNNNGIVLKNTKLENYLPPLPGKAAKGGEGGDAADFGYKSFIVEVLNQNCVKGHKFAPIDDVCTGQKGESRIPSYEVFQKELYPIIKQFFIAVTESVAVPKAKKGKK